MKSYKFKANFCEFTVVDEQLTDDGHLVDSHIKDAYLDLRSIKRVEGRAIDEIYDFTFALANSGGGFPGEWMEMRYKLRIDVSSNYVAYYHLNNCFRKLLEQLPYRVLRLEEVVWAFASRHYYCD